MNELFQRIHKIGIIPVISIDDADKAVPLARALTAGGIPAAEVTFRTEAAEEAIRRIAQACPKVLVGAGTVLNEEQCGRALAAGAKFIVSPGYNEALAARCQARDIPILPGCVTASDMTKACNDGLEAVKFFPAEASGGVAFLKSMAPVFPRLKFMPTGGVNAENLKDYLSYDQVLACGGTWMVRKDLIEGEQWEKITALCKEAVKMMLGFSLHHVGIPCGDEAAAAHTAKAIGGLFGFPYREGRSSDYAMPWVECCKTASPGERGHIAIGVSDVDRAVFHLSLQGVSFLEETRKSDDKGTKAVYMEGNFGGFAIHLVRK